jgi:hypothetical protein
MHFKRNRLATPFPITSPGDENEQPKALDRAMEGFGDEACDLPLHLTSIHFVQAICSLLLRGLFCLWRETPSAFPGGGPSIRI